MTETTFFEFGATFLQILVKTFSEVFDWLSQPFVAFIESVPVEIPSYIITYLQNTLGDTSILMMMFGTALTTLIVITLVKWVIGIVM